MGSIRLYTEKNGRFYVRITQATGVDLTELVDSETNTAVDFPREMTPAVLMNLLNKVVVETRKQNTEYRAYLLAEMLDSGMPLPEEAVDRLWEAIMRRINKR